MIKTRRVLSILLAFTIIITILQSVTIPVKAGSEDFEYKKLADGTIEITSYKGSDEDISIPSMIDGYTVSRIGSGAFEYNESIKNITLPDSIRSIGYNAFIDTGYFLDESNWQGDLLYLGAHLLKAKREISGHCTLKDGTKTIAEEAFENCEQLEKVNLPDSLISIGYKAFSWCESLTEIAIPYSVNNIGEYAFDYCWNLETISLPSHSLDIGSGAFSDTGYVENKENWDNQVLYIGNHLIDVDGYKNGEFSIKAGTVDIADDALSQCDNLTGIVIPNSVEIIGDFAFIYCENLLAINIPYSVKYIGENAFSNCTSLSVVSIPDNLKFLGEEAFKDCKNLTMVTIGNSVTTIGKRTFYGCEKLSDVHLGDNVKVIGDSAFMYCDVKNINIPDSVESIDDYAFSYCSNLKNIVLGKNIKLIGMKAFDSCYLLSEITIDNKIQTIGWMAFYDCESLKDVYYGGTEDEWDEIDIQGCNSYFVNANIHFTERKDNKDDIAEKAKYSIAVFSTEKSLSVKTGDKMWLAFGLMDNSAHMLDDSWKKMAITNSNPSIISLSDYKETEYGYSLELSGLKQGSTNLTITDTDSGTNTIITVKVYDEYLKTYSYDLKNVPSFYPDNKFENHLQTNIYDLNGLYVNNYSCQTKSNGYNISFDVYNTKYYSGAVDIYDADGIWMGYEEIAKYSTITSLYDTGEQILYLITDPFTKDCLTYQQGSYSKKSHISFEVPSGGFFVVSNNIAESPGTFFSNALEIVFDGASVALDLATKGIDKTTALDGFKKAGKETLTKRLLNVHNETLNKNVKKKMQEMWLNSMKSEVNKITREVSKSELKDKILDTSNVYSNISTLCENVLSSYNISWKHLLQTSTGIWESAFTELAGPAGVALKGCFAITKGTNKLSMGIQMAASTDNTYATFYSDTTDVTINKNGVVIDTKGNIDEEAVLQVFRVSNNNVVQPLLDSSLQKAELYNISFVKNDKSVQPNGKVKVSIPIPSDMKGNTCKVYRKENNEEWCVLDAHIEGNYLVFETDHFSLYSVVGESKDIKIYSLPDKTIYHNNDILNTTGLALNIDGEIITEGYICSPTVVTKETNTITVTYGSLSTTLPITVLPKEENPTDTTEPNSETENTEPTEPFEPVIEPTEPATKATSPMITPIVKKRNNPIKVTTKTKSVKKKKLKSKKQTVKPLSITKAKGKYTVSLVKSGTTKKIRSRISVNKKGAITFKKGKYKKGTYKVKLKIAVKGNAYYKSRMLTKTVKIKIK